MRPVDFLDAMASVDEKYTDASASSPRVGSDNRSTARRRILASASAVILMLSATLAIGMISATVMGILPEKLFPGRAGTDAQTPCWTIEFCEWDMQYALERPIGKYAGEMRPEDCQAILGIRGGYEHKKGLVDCFPDVWFRISSGGDNATESLSYHAGEGILSYYKSGGESGEEISEYDRLSDADRSAINSIIEKYRSELVFWTFKSGDAEKRLADDDRQEFLRIWSKCCTYTNHVRYWNSYTGPVPPEAEEAAALIDGKEAAFSLIFNNVLHEPAYISYYAEPCVLVCVQATGEDSGEPFVQYVFANSLCAAEIAGLAAKYGVTSDKLKGHDSWSVSLYRCTGIPFISYSSSPPEDFANVENPYVPQNGGIRPQIRLISSSEELDSFIKTFSHYMDLGHLFNFRNEEAFTESADKYGPGFFENKVLILVRFSAPSGGDLYDVWVQGPVSPYVERESPDGGGLVITITKTFSGATDDVGGWLAAVEIDRAVYESNPHLCAVFAD